MVNTKRELKDSLLQRGQRGTRDQESVQARRNSGKGDVDTLLDDLRGEGLVAVPQKPTTDMIIAGSRAADVSPGVVMAIYQAMLAATEKER